jgi:hypothetical protein
VGYSSSSTFNFLFDFEHSSEGEFGRNELSNTGFTGGVVNSSFAIRMTQGSTLKLKTFHGHSSSANVDAAKYRTYMTIVFLGPMT